MSCLVCGLSFTRCDNLKKHLKTHQEKDAGEKESEEEAENPMEKEMEYCCEQCGFKTKRRGNLIRHMKSAHKVIIKKKKTSRQKKYM